MSSINGATDEVEKNVIQAINFVVDHGFGQVVLVVSDHKIIHVLPAPSVKPQDDLPPFLAMRFERKIKHG